RSPTETSMSSSRESGCGEISPASRINSSVVSPIAETTATTRLPPSLAATQRRATFFSRSLFATDEPPNFITTRPGERGARSTAGTTSYSVAATSEQCRRLVPRPRLAGSYDLQCIGMDTETPRRRGRQARHAMVSGPEIRVDRTRAGVGIVELSGEHDVYTRQRLEDALDALLGDDVDLVV